MTKIATFIRRHFEGSLLLLIFIGILAIVFLAYYKLAILNFFFIPVIISGYFLGRKRAVLTAVLCVCAVIFYLVFFNLIYEIRAGLSFDEIISLVSWASFLILTAAIIGMFSEQAETRLKKMRRSYIGALKIILKYMEVADEKKPHTLRVSLLAGKIARAAGLSPGEIENIKSAALLHDMGDLSSSLPFFEEMADFMKSDVKVSETQTVNREQVLMNTTASLLRTIEPILRNYYRYYIQEAHRADKDLKEIPYGSSIVALANLYDKVATHFPASFGGESIKSLEDIEKFSGRSFPALFIRALKEVVKTSD